MKSNLFSSSALLLGIVSIALVVWDCYRGIWLSVATMTPILVFIAIPAGILLLISWRKEIRNWAVVPAGIFAGFAACAGCTIIQWVDLSYSSWREYSIIMIAYFIIGKTWWTPSIFVFYGSLYFFKNLTSPSATSNPDQLSTGKDLPTK